MTGSNSMFICAAPISDSAVVKSQCGKHTLTSVHLLIIGQSCFMPRQVFFQPVQFCVLWNGGCNKLRSEPFSHNFAFCICIICEEFLSRSSANIYILKPFVQITKPQCLLGLLYHTVWFPRPWCTPNPHLKKVGLHLVARLARQYYNKVLHWS